MEDLSDVVKKKAKPLITRYQREFNNLYDVLNVRHQASIEEIFTAYRSKRKNKDIQVEEAFHVLSSSFYRLVYDSAFSDRLGFKRNSTDSTTKRQEDGESATLKRRKRQTFLMIFILGFIVAVPALFINIPIGSMNLGWIVFLSLVFLSSLTSFVYSYISFSYFDQQDKLSARRVRRTLWIEPSIDLARFEITYNKGSKKHKLFANGFLLDTQFEFIGEDRSFADKIFVSNYWIKGLFGWTLKKYKLSIPIEETMKICERK